jgi:hypothetical protein
MNINVVDNEIYIYDIGIKKRSWCAIHLTDMANGLFYIKEDGGQFSFICKRYRKVRREWEITDDEFGIDNDTIIIESREQKIELDLSAYNILKNTVLSVEICRNKDGLIFGVRWKV